MSKEFAWFPKYTHKRRGESEGSSSSETIKAHKEKKVILEATVESFYLSLEREAAEKVQQLRRKLSSSVGLSPQQLEALAADLSQHTLQDQYFDDFVARLADNNLLDNSTVTDIYFINFYQGNAKDNILILEIFNGIVRAIQRRLRGSDASNANDNN